MKILLTSLTILVYKLAVCQIYYNQHVGYDSNNLYNGYKHIIIDNEIINCFGFNNTGNGTGYYFDKFDSEANLVLRKSYSEDSTYFVGGDGENSLMKFGNNILCAGASYKIDNPIDGLLYKFNQLGDTLWVKKRNKANALGTYYRFSIKTSENDFVTVGDVGYYNSSVNFNFGQVYLVKFDTLANVIWEHEYGNPGTVSEFVKGIYPAADGGFFIYGYVTGYQQWSQCYLLKVDAMGNQVWQRSWGDLYHDELRGFYEMPNGNLLVSGYISSDFFGGEVTNAYLAMLTPDGSQRIWEKRLFGIIDYDDLSTIFKNNDGTFHIWGHETTPYITRPFLMHFSANFDSLDTKYYSYWNGPGAQNYIRDIVKMSDQGYVACGFGWDNNSDQDGWLLRIDSNGCANVNCTPLAVKEIEDVSEKFILAPNPTKDKITILGNNQLAIKTVKLFDIAGHLIDVPLNSRELDVSHLSVGIYIIEVTDSNGNVQRLKAMKE
jgi:hypothetical protein